MAVRVRITGVFETLQAFNKLPKDANKELRERSNKLAQLLAEKAKQNARADESPQAALLVPTIKARRDRAPVIAAGGARRLGSRRRPAWKLLYGSEFGSNKHTQFRKSHLGRQGSWLFRTADENEELIDREWNKAAAEIMRKWAEGGSS